MPVDMACNESVATFAAALAAQGTPLDGVVLMPSQPHAANDYLPPSSARHDLFQTSFIGPLALLKTAITTMRPEVARGKRCKIVIISGLSSVHVLGHYATSNVLRCAWVDQAKTLAGGFTRAY